VADRLAALAAPQLAALAADLLVEAHAALVADAFTAFAAGLADRHAALPVGAIDGHASSPRSLLRLRRGHDLAPYRGNVLLAGGHRPGSSSLVGGLLPLFDQLADLVAALLADLLIERSAALRLHRIAALLADLLVE